MCKQMIIDLKDDIFSEWITDFPEEKTALMHVNIAVNGR